MEVRSGPISLCVLNESKGIFHRHLEMAFWHLVEWIIECLFWLVFWILPYPSNLGSTLQIPFLCEFMDNACYVNRKDEKSDLLF